MNKYIEKILEEVGKNVDVDIPRNEFAKAKVMSS